MTRRVFIRDLEVSGSIGIYEEEKRAPQRIVINVDLLVEEGPADDRIESVVSYEEVAKTIEAIVAERHYNLVETLAERIAASCLADSRLFQATVRVEKPDIISNAGSVGVEITKTR